MSEDQYFVIYNSDGDTTVRQYSKEALLERLAENYWGAKPMMPEAFEPLGADTNYWGGKLLIIKGTIARVIPPGDWRIE